MRANQVGVFFLDYDAFGADADEKGSTLSGQVDMKVLESMAATDETPEASPLPKKRRGVSVHSIERALGMLGLSFVVPLLRLARGEDAAEQLRDLWQSLGIPLLAIGVFLLVWSRSSAGIVTSLGQIPGPAAVATQAKVLWEAHQAGRAEAAAFYERQTVRNAEKLAADPAAVVTVRKFTGKPTFLDQIATSLKTVFIGFFLASLVAIPLGVVCGLSPTMNAAFHPLIQIFKPVSPLAWLPIVTMVVSAVYVSDDPMFEKSFLNSAITVTLCSLWPTVINTAMGVSSIDRDLINVARTLQLDWRTRLFKLVLPSSLPLIFTGLRLSLGVGWMVLIAAEMLAQNPGLGKFVWDEFQNGSSDSLARIMVAVFTIGGIGFLLDRVMMTIQELFSFERR
jgi:nitrate/nitrite transport system permease protein